MSECASGWWQECLRSSINSERSDAYLMFDFIPGTFWVRRVLSVKECIIDPRERLSCILIMAAGGKNDVPIAKTNVFMKRSWRRDEISFYY